MSGAKLKEVRVCLFWSGSSRECNNVRKEDCVHKRLDQNDMRYEGVAGDE